jgi:hypothetical protein
VSALLRLPQHSVGNTCKQRAWQVLAWVLILFIQLFNELQHKVWHGAVRGQPVPQPHGAPGVCKFEACSKTLHQRSCSTACKPRKSHSAPA